MTFEDRLAEAFEQYGRAAPTTVDSRALAATLARQPRSRLTWLALPSMRAGGLRTVIILGLLALASAAALVVVGSPTPRDAAPLGGGGRILVWLPSDPGGGTAHLIGVDGTETARRAFASRSGGCPVLLGGVDGVAASGFGSIRFGSFRTSAYSQVSISYTGGERWSRDQRVLALMNFDDDSITLVAVPDGDVANLSSTRYPLASSLDDGDGAFSPDGRRFVVVSHGEAATTRVTLIEEGATQPRDLARIPSMAGQAYPLISWAPDGSRFVIVTKDGGGSRLTLITVEDGSVRHLDRPDRLGSGTSLVPLAWSPDGRALLVQSEAGDLWLLDVARGAFLPAGTHAPTYPEAVRWWPDGNGVAIKDGAVLTLRRFDGAPDATIQLPGEGVSWSPDGQVLAVLAVDTDTVWAYHPWDGAPAQVMATLLREPRSGVDPMLSCIQWLPEVNP